MPANAAFHELHDLVAKLRRRRVSGAQDHEGLDDLSSERVGNADRRGLGNRRVIQDGALDLERPDAVARTLDYVIGATLEPEVAVRISPSEITDGHPAATVHGRRALGVAQ